jgi:tetratricopeptide (TPR) repeat protein
VFWLVPLVILPLCTLRTRVEAQAWRDNRTLYGSDVAREPHNGIALYHYGTSVVAERGCRDALPYFVEATRQEPDYARAWTNVTGCLLGLGRYEEALVPAQRALALRPRAASSYFNLGLALLRTGQPARARISLSKALEIDPRHEKARAALREIDALGTR